MYGEWQIPLKKPIKPNGDKNAPEDFEDEFQVPFFKDDIQEYNRRKPEYSDNCTKDFHCRHGQCFDATKGKLKDTEDLSTIKSEHDL